MKLIVSKLAYWPVWIAIVNQKSSKVIVSVPTLVYCSIYTMQSTSTTQSTMHFPQYTPSTKWFPLECAYYSMVFIALIYNSGSQNILINNWYACLHVPCKQFAVWNAQFVCWIITTIESCFFFDPPTHWDRRGSYIIKLTNY